jgi:hypothetical protein
MLLHTSDLFHSHVKIHLVSLRIFDIFLRSYSLLVHPLTPCIMKEDANTQS